MSKDKGKTKGTETTETTETKGTTPAETPAEASALAGLITPAETETAEADALAAFFALMAPKTKAPKGETEKAEGERVKRMRDALALLRAETAKGNPVTVKKFGTTFLGLKDGAGVYDYILLRAVSGETVKTTTNEKGETVKTTAPATFYVPRPAEKARPVKGTADEKGNPLSYRAFFPTCLPALAVAPFGLVVAVTDAGNVVPVDLSAEAWGTMANICSAVVARETAKPAEGAMADVKGEDMKRGMALVTICHERRDALTLQAQKPETETPAEA